MATSAQKLVSPNCAPKVRSISGVSDSQLRSMTPEVRSVSGVSDSQLRSITPEVRSISRVSDSQLRSITPGVRSIRGVSDSQLLSRDTHFYAVGRHPLLRTPGCVAGSRFGSVRDEAEGAERPSHVPRRRESSARATSGRGRARPVHGVSSGRRSAAGGDRRSSVSSFNR